MAGLTEAGEVLLNALVDEFGRRRTDGLLEDGTRAFVISGGQVFEVFADAVSGAVSACLPRCVFGVGADAAVSLSSVQASSSAFNVGVNAGAGASSNAAVQSVFSLDRAAAVEALAGAAVAKVGEASVTRLFLVLGDLAIQLTGD